MRPSLPIEFRSRPVGWVQTRKMRRSVGEAGRPCLGARTTAWRSSRRHGGPLSGPMQKAPPDGRRPMLTLVWGSRDLQPSKRTFVPLRDSVLGPGCVKTPKRQRPLESAATGAFGGRYFESHDSLVIVQPLLYTPSGAGMLSRILNNRLEASS